MCRRTQGNPLHGWSKQSSCSSHMGSEGVYTGAKISTLVFAYHVAHNATTECSLGSHLASHAPSLQPSLPRDCSWRLVRRAHAPGTRGCGCCAWNPRRPRFSACTTIAGQPPAPLPSVHAHARLRHERQTPRSTHPVVHALRAMPWSPCDAYTHTTTHTRARTWISFSASSSEVPSSSLPCAPPTKPSRTMLPGDDPTTGEYTVLPSSLCSAMALICPAPKELMPDGILNCLRPLARRWKDTLPRGLPGRRLTLPTDREEPPSSNGGAVRCVAGLVAGGRREVTGWKASATNLPLTKSR